MGVVGSFVGDTSQVDYIGRHGIGSGVDRSTASETVGDSSGSSLLVGDQNAPGVARADARQRGRLVRNHVLCQ